MGMEENGFGFNLINYGACGLTHRVSSKNTKKRITQARPDKMHWLKREGGLLAGTIQEKQGCVGTNRNNPVAKTRDRPVYNKDPLRLEVLDSQR